MERDELNEQVGELNETIEQLEKWEQEQAAAEDMRRAVNQLMELANGGIGGIKPNKAADQIVDAITRQHRTHQQEFMGVLKLVLYRYAKGSYDLRNEAAVEWAKQVASLPNSDLRFPFF